MNPYETTRLLSEYLLFHYGTAEETVSFDLLPRAALGFPVRCVTECVDVSRLTESSRALDLGCAVGRTTFELARHCGEVIGFDYSRSFIEAARALREHGELEFNRRNEGDLVTPLVARVPAEIDRSRVAFEVGDAMNLRLDLGEFDVVLMANLIDRLTHPRRCLTRLAALMKPGAQLIITSPCTWLEEFTPHENWLGGFELEAGPVTTLEGLRVALCANFELQATRDLPFLIREHARKFQLSLAQASMWIRR